MQSEIIKVYNIAIYSSIIMIILAILQLIFRILNLPVEYPIAIVIFAPVGLLSFLIGKRDYIKNNTTQWFYTNTRYIKHITK